MRAIGGQGRVSLVCRMTCEEKEDVFNSFHPCHQHLLMENGIHLHEGMTFEGLIEREAWVFACVFAPLPIVGATGSPGNPIAVL